MSERIAGLEIQAARERATQVMAGIVVEVFRDPYMIDQRAQTAAAFALLSELAYGADNPEEHLFDNLVEAGANQVGAAQLASLLARPNTQRTTFGFSHLKEDLPEYGIHKRNGRIKGDIDEPKLLRRLIRIGKSS